MQESLEIEAIVRATLNQLAEIHGNLPEITMNEFSKLYMENYAKPHKRSWKADLGRLKLYILPAFGERPIHSIRRAEIAALHGRLSGTPYAANRVIEQLGVMYKQAQIWGFYADEKRLPTAGIKTFREFKREAFIHKDQIARLAAAMEIVRSPRYRILFWLYLLTGLRRSELLDSQWSWLDESRWEFTVPAKKSKNGKIHVIPLTKEAAALFSSLPRMPGNPYIFAGAKPGRPLTTSTVWHVWDRVRRKAEMTDICIHGLRHTFASHLVQSGCALALIGKLLNQSSARSTEIYAHFARDNRQDALEAHSGELSRYIQK